MNRKYWFKTLVNGNRELRVDDGCGSNCVAYRSRDTSIPFDIVLHKGCDRGREVIIYSGEVESLRGNGLIGYIRESNMPDDVKIDILRERHNFVYRSLRDDNIRN